MYKVKKEYEEAVLTYFKNRVVNMKMKDLPQSILSVLHRGQHPGVIKQEDKKEK